MEIVSLLDSDVSEGEKQYAFDLLNRLNHQYQDIEQLLGKYCCKD